jgi:hypothetical protein
VKLLAQPLKLRLTRDESDPGMSDYGRYSVYSLYWYKSTNTDAKYGSNVVLIEPLATIHAVHDFLVLILLALLVQKCKF